MSKQYSTSSKKMYESASLQLALVMKSGKYTMGVNYAMKAIRNGQAKQILVANNLPKLIVSQITYMCMMQKIDVAYQNTNSRDFGLALGKAFNVGVMAILDAGDADLRAFRY